MKKTYPTQPIYIRIIPTIDSSSNCVISPLNGIIKFYKFSFVYMSLLLKCLFELVNQMLLYGVPISKTHMCATLLRYNDSSISLVAWFQISSHHLRILRKFVKIVNNVLSSIYTLWLHVMQIIFICAYVCVWIIYIISSKLEAKWKILMSLTII